MRTAKPLATPPWCAVIFQVTSQEKQQEVLTLLQQVSGLTALGTFHGDDFFIVLGCVDQAMKRSTERLIEGIDPGCVETFVADLRPHAGVH